MFWCVIFFAFAIYGIQGTPQSNEITGMRHLLWSPWDNCSSPAVLDFPYPSLPHGPYILIIVILIIFYGYIALERLCDIYFVPSLGVSSDFAGVAILASASCAPELALTLVATLVTEDADIGVTSIVGSSVFNTLAVPAVCALIAAVQESACDYRAVTRDTVVSILSLLILLYVLEDNMITWNEALFMLLFYLCYVVALHLAFKEKRTKRLQNKHVYDTLYHPLKSSATTIKLYDTVPSETKDEMSYDVHIKGKKKSFKSVCVTIFWILISPLTYLFRYTIPGPEKYPKICCFISVAWIAGITYILTWMISILGYKLNIPDSLMGLTVLAVGLGIPDMLASLSAAKQGNGSMALSNALGSNTFNILVCLGFPWLIKALFFPDGDDTDDGALSFDINGDGILYSVFTMLGAMIALYFVLAINGYRLNKSVGWISIFLYLSFVLSGILLEMNVFYEVNLPMCNIKDFYLDD